MKLIIVLFLFLYCVGIGNSQAGFQGAGVLGLTTSQIDGDSLLGFNKLGLSTGIKVRFNVSKKIGGHVELLYSQRGSSTNLFTRKDEHSITKLNYFELPAYFTFNDWYMEGEGYFKMSGHLGLSYAALISSSIQNTIYSDEGFSKSDLSYIFGATFHFTKKWALTVRYTRALTRLLEDEALSNKHLLTYFWTIRTEYYF